MVDLLEAGADWLTDELKDNVSQSVVYRRGANTVTVVATRGQTDHEVRDTDGILQIERSEDFLIKGADLIISGSVVLPERGDQIDFVVGATTYTYEALPFGATDDHWRWSDRYQKLLRIHTKLIDET